jgi:DNA-binding NarL/FixJ family response regulator
MKKIYVVDDHPVMRRGYASLFEREPHLTLVGTTASAEDALREIPHLTPDLVIADVSLPGLNGIEFVKRLQLVEPELPVLFISMHDETLYAERALAAGARGYLMKSEDDTKVLGAIQRILDGNYYLSDKMATRLLSQLTGRGKQETVQAGAELKQLSDRELEVFELIGRGLSTREIAKRLHISPKTVESHRSRMKAKLSAGSATDLLRRAVQWVEAADHVALVQNE